MSSARETWPLSGHENDRLCKYGGGAGIPSRDLLGYGPSPAVVWPKGAKVALSFVMNYEEGGERCTLHGDSESESLLSDCLPHDDVSPLADQRNTVMESLYDYGARAGFWRLHSLFTKRKVPLTVFAVGMALERNPAVCLALREQPDWEVASHGYRWINYHNVEEDVEREHIRRAIRIHEQLLGKRPVGMYQGKVSQNTRRLVVEEGGFKYDSDSYCDDLPYWNRDYGDKLHLTIPYTLTENDMRYTTPNGYPNGDAFGRDLKETLRYMVEEGRAGHQRMMSVGLHCRLSHPGRDAALAEFLEFAKSYGREVWICTREQIADYWMEHHSPKGAGSPMKTQHDNVGELPRRTSSRDEESTDSAEEGDEKAKSEDDGDGDVI
ncbi:hypothetical protein ACA910_012637 [Epithemia clementina (nom. ined.)]